MWSDKGTRHALTADVLGKMFYLDEQNRLQLSLAGSLYVGPDGKIRIRTGDTLSEGPGSPIELNANPRASQFTTVTQEVVDESVSTITIDLQTLRTLLTAPLAGMVFGRGSASAGSGEWLTLGTNLSMSGTTLNVTGVDSRVFTTYEGTLSAGVVNIGNGGGYDFGAANTIIFAPRRTVMGSRPGILEVVVADSETLSVTSFDASDDGTIQITVLGTYLL